MSEDFRNRVWEERNQMVAGVVAEWDVRTYRLAEAHLRLLCADRNILAALSALQEAGGELGTSWRLSPKDDARVQAAWEAHRAAVDQFVAAGMRVFARDARRGRSSVLAIPPIGAP
jgi:hypothetical protein